MSQNGVILRCSVELCRVLQILTTEKGVAQNIHQAYIEKLLSLTIIPPGDAYSIRVIDSLQFMMGSLSSLVENQKK